MVSGICHEMREEAKMEDDGGTAVVWITPHKSHVDNLDEVWRVDESSYLFKL